MTFCIQGWLSVLDYEISNFRRFLYKFAKKNVINHGKINGAIKSIEFFFYLLYTPQSDSSVRFNKNKLIPY